MKHAHLLSMLASLSLLSACSSPPAALNQAPVATASPVQNATALSTITLEGRASHDPENSKLTYQWTLQSAPTGSRATISNATSATATFTPDLAGEYVFRLVVSDGVKTGATQLTVRVSASTTESAPSTPSDAPIANAGPDRSGTAGLSVSLDASSSTDPKGRSLTYSWTVSRRPSGSTLQLTNPSAAKVSFTPDAAGEYEFKVLVSNGTSSASDTVLVQVQPNQPPIANAGKDEYAYLGETLALSGASSTDPEQQPLSFTWSIAVKPDNSTATIPSGSVNVNFKPDVEGFYRIDLKVSDGVHSSNVDSLIVEAGRAFQKMSFRPIDAEYSDTLDRIVMVSSDPAQLHIYNPEANTATVVNLLLAPTSVSVSPDGRYAAVGHDAHISYVDLVGGRLVKTLNVSVDVLDVVLAGNGYVYAFPRRDQWASIHSVNIASNQETQSPYATIYAGTLAKLHPSGKYIYGADNGLSPSDIAKYDIRNSTAVGMYDSPYHGDYSMCGNLWFSQDGARIFTRCGNVFRSSEVRSEDMRYNGSLKTGVRSLDHNTSANLIAVVPESSWNASGDDSKIKLFGYDYLTPSAEHRLPKWKVNSTVYSTHGQFVFFNSTGSKYYVIIKAQSNSGILKDFGVVTYLIH